MVGFFKEPSLIDILKWDIKNVTVEQRRSSSCSMEQLLFKAWIWSFFVLYCTVLYCTVVYLRAQRAPKSPLEELEVGGHRPPYLLVTKYLKLPCHYFLYYSFIIRVFNLNIRNLEPNCENPTPPAPPRLLLAKILFAQRFFPIRSSTQHTASQNICLCFS